MRCNFPPLQVLELSLGCASAKPQTNRHTQVSIRGEDFYLNGQPTYAGWTWNDHRIEGLLLNARLVQGIFDGLNPETVGRWNYPDTDKWDVERNTREFIAAMPECAGGLAVGSERKREFFQLVSEMAGTNAAAGRK